MVRLGTARRGKAWQGEVQGMSKNNQRKEGIKCKKIMQLH